MISTKTRPNESEETLVLQQMQKLNSWNLRSLDDDISNKVDLLMNTMNTYNNSSLTPEILETLLFDWHMLEKTDCERHINTNWEYVHVLSLLDNNEDFVTYIELRCKPNISWDENKVYMKSWKNKLEISNQSIVNQQLITVSPYVYLSNEWNQTARWSWVQSI